MLIPVVSPDPADRAEHFVPLQSIFDARRHPDGDWQVLTATGWQTADPEVMNALARMTQSLTQIRPAHEVSGFVAMPMHMPDNVVSFRP